MKPLLIANWKMNPASAKEAANLARSIRKGLAGRSRVAIIVAPPFPFLSEVRSILGQNISVAAQDVAPFPTGAYTGAVSATMLKYLGVKAVLIGHSERRRFFGETDEIIHQKIKMTLKAGLRPILAIGEELSDSHDVVPQVLADQLARSLAGIPKKKLSHLVVAYEPVWAIGSGKADTPDNATRRAIYIRKLLTKLLGNSIAARIPILYGGSVTSKNVASFLVDDIRGMDGLLVGGASLRADEFLSIVRVISPRYNRMPHAFRLGRKVKSKKPKRSPGL